MALQTCRRIILIGYLIGAEDILQLGIIYYFNDIFVSNGRTFLITLKVCDVHEDKCVIKQSYLNF